MRMCDVNLALHAGDGAGSVDGSEAIDGLVEDAGGLGVDLGEASEKMAELEIDGGAIGLGDRWVVVVGAVAVGGAVRVFRGRGWCGDVGSSGFIFQGGGLG